MSDLTGANAVGPRMSVIKYITIHSNKLVCSNSRGTLSWACYCLFMRLNQGYIEGVWKTDIGKTEKQRYIKLNYVFRKLSI